MTHHPCDTDLCHCADDTTETHVPDAEHREALELLGYAATGRVRLTVREWRQATRVAGAIRDARNAARRPLSASEGERHHGYPERHRAIQGDE